MGKLLLGSTSLYLTFISSGWQASSTLSLRNNHLELANLDNDNHHPRISSVSSQMFWNNFHARIFLKIVPYIQNLHTHFGGNMLHELVDNYHSDTCGCISGPFHTTWHSCFSKFVYPYVCSYTYWSPKPYNTHFNSAFHIKSSIGTFSMPWSICFSYLDRQRWPPIKNLDNFCKETPIEMRLILLDR